MAEKVEIDIPGIGLIEAKNAATEATLIEILDVLRATQRQNQKNASNAKGAPAAGGAGGGGGAGLGAAAGAAATMGASLGLAGKAATMMGRTVGLAGKTIGFGAGLAVTGLVAAGKAATSIVNGLIGLGHTAVDLANQLANMGDSVSAAANVVSTALSKLPGILGAVGSLIGSVFTAVAGSAEKMVGAYQTAAAVGATFGGNLNAMNAAASAAGMTMDNFAKLLANNAASLVYLGGTTDSGARRFADLAKTMRNSGVNAELTRMGFTTEQINNGMAEFIGMMGKSGALQNMTTDQIAKSSGAYLKDLDALRRLTGESAAQQKAANDKLMADAQFRAAMLGKDAETQKAMMAYINSLPEELRDGAKEMLATGQVTSEAGVKFAAALPGAANEAMAFGRNLKAGGKLSMDESLRARQNLISEAKIRQNTLKDQAMYNQDLQGTMLGVMNAAASSSKSYAEIQREQAEAAKKENLAQSIEDFKKRIAEISNTFMSLLANSGMLDLLADTFENVVGVMATFVIPALKALFAGIQMVLPPLMNVLVPVITSLVQALVSITSTILGSFAPIFTNTIIPVFTSIAAAVTGLLKPAVEGVSNIFRGLDETTGGLGKTISGIIDGVFPIFNSVIRGVSLALEGFMTGIGYVIGPIQRLFKSVTNLFGGTDGLTGIFLHVGSIVGGVFEYLGVIVGGIIDVFSFAIDIVGHFVDMIQHLFSPIGTLVGIFGDLINKSDFLRMVMQKVGEGFDFLKMIFSPAGINALFSGLRLVIGSISDFILDFKDGFKNLLAELFLFAGKLFPSLKEKGEEMKKEIAEDKKARDETAKERKADFDRSAALAKTDYDRKKTRIEDEKKAIAEDKKGYDQQKSHLAKMGTLNKAAEDAKKKESEPVGGVDMSSPLAMLESFSKQQSGFFGERIDQARQEQKVRLEIDAAKQQMAEAEKKYAEAKTEAEKKAAIDAAIAAQQRINAIKEESKQLSRPGAAPSPSVAPTKLPAGSQVTGLGAVAAHFEAGGKAGTVSTGHGDFGGKSYGAFQLSSKTGDVQKFLEKSGYAAQFKGMEVGSKEFDAKWKELGATKEFAQAQAAHAKTTHYDPQMQKLSKAGLDMSGRGAGVQEAIMSTANQYGANTDLIMKALKDKDTSKMSDKDIINAIQDYKAQTVQTRFKSSSANVREGVAKRIEQERAMLLGVDGGATQADVRKTDQAQEQKGKPPESKPGKEPTPKIDPKLANDWAYSVFIGKNSMSQVPKPYLDEVGKILAKPPANWVGAPKTPEAKVETAQTDQGKPPEQKPVEEVKSKPGAKAIKNWAYAVFEGKITLGQVPQMYREQVAELLKNPPADWAKAPAASKELASVDMMQSMGAMLPIGSDISAENILGQGLETFTTKMPEDDFGIYSADAAAQVESQLGSTSALTSAEGFKQTMAEDAAAKMAEEQQARKAMFEMMGRTDVEGSIMQRSGQASGKGGEKAASPLELLNSRLDQLISINQNIANLNSDQLRVQKNFNTGDVYNSAG